MSKEKCRTCLFGDQCYSNTECEYYSPVDDYDADEELEIYIEKQRQEFHEYWNEIKSENRYKYDTMIKGW